MIRGENLSPNSTIQKEGLCLKGIDPYRRMIDPDPYRRMIDLELEGSKLVNYQENERYTHLK